MLYEIVRPFASSAAHALCMCAVLALPVTRAHRRESDVNQRVLVHGGSPGLRASPHAAQRAWHGVFGRVCMVCRELHSSDECVGVIHQCVQARQAELKVLGGHLVHLSQSQGADVPWRIVDSVTMARVTASGTYSCASDKDRPLRGCSESWNALDDEALVKQAKEMLNCA
jgi:hypothetical protein